MLPNEHVGIVIVFSFPNVIVVSFSFNTKDVTVGFVGDLAQSIYSFQGADYTMLESAMFESKDQIQYVIDGNRRSTENIINFCNYIRKEDKNLSAQKCELNFDNKKEQLSSFLFLFILVFT